MEEQMVTMTLQSFETQLALQKIAGRTEEHNRILGRIKKLSESSDCAYTHGTTKELLDKSAVIAIIGDEVGKVT